MRPDNIWDVLSNTADYASQAIPAYQREKRDLATQERQFGLRAAADARQQESLDNYRQSQLGFQRARLDAAGSKGHPTAHPSFDAVLTDIMLNPGKYPASVVADFKAAAAERHPGPKEPEPKRAPNFVGDIQGDYEQRLGRWTRRRQDAATTPSGRTTVDAQGNTVALPMDFNEPEPTLEQSYGLKAGEFSRYPETSGPNAPDSIRAGLGLKPMRPQARLGAQSMLPSHHTGGYGPDGSFPTEQEYLEAKAMGIVQ